MKKKATIKQVKLYTLPEVKSSERQLLWAKKFAKKMEVQFERVSNKEYQSWLTK